MGSSQTKIPNEGLGFRVCAPHDPPIINPFMQPRPENCAGTMLNSFLDIARWKGTSENHRSLSGVVYKKVYSVSSLYMIYSEDTPPDNLPLPDHG